MPSEQLEDYLKNIYKIQTSEGKVSTTLLSQKLRISPPSVTEMLKKLAEEGIVSHTPYKGVQLTREGRRMALQIIRRHRLWEAFLVDVLKYDWHEIDEEAEKLEHIASERLERRIDEILGYPSTDPHGDAIPTREGKVQSLQHDTLAEVTPGNTATVRRVSDANPDILRYMSKLGIALNTKIKVKERIDFDGSLRVEVGGKQEFISAKLARHIFVTVIERTEKSA
ncbi:MAG: metal-dependent transcriptional regulator [Ignavibacteriales bacterium]|nr:metal-dependent transcriptional regulator [Ignavibacteriales bacterium]